MAFDDAMLGHVLHHPGLVLLRLYTWQEGTITIGANQEPERAVCLEKLGGTPLIRRLTGGRAVYHDLTELTYAMALHVTSVLPGEEASSSAIYLKLAEGLQLFLSRLGIASQVVRRSSADARGAARLSIKSCFTSTARYELVTRDIKVLASAQRRVGDAILQHGSIKMHGPVPHPALPDLTMKSSHTGQPLGRNELERLAGVFGRALCDIIGATGFSLSGSLDPFPDLGKRFLYLRENPLLKRDLH